MIASALPASAVEALLRGARNRCPRCAAKPFFPKFLKPVAQCRGCAQDWTPQRADDFPAYLAIFITGHLLAPVIIALVSKGHLPLWVLFCIIIGAAIVMLGLLIQPCKGAVIALQWWLGMHGFERPVEPK